MYLFQHHAPICLKLIVSSEKQPLVQGAWHDRRNRVLKAKKGAGKHKTEAIVQTTHYFGGNHPLIYKTVYISVLC